MPTPSPLPRQPVPPAPANDLDRDYRILGPLGSSLTGTSFLARHREIGRLVVVKLMHEHAPERVATRFEREARALARVSHEHVAKLFGYGRVADGRRYMIVEHVEGRTLRQLLERWGSLPTARALRLLEQLAAALEAVHGAGLVHRNLKPESVFVGEGRDGRELVKLANFGLVRDTLPRPERGDREDTKTGAMTGTPRYWAPEQVLGASVDHRADVYAFGVLAYELLIGEPPFKSTTLEGFAWQHVHGRVPRPLDAQGRPRLAPELEGLLARCLEKHPGDRFGSMRELRAALRATRRQLGAGRQAPPRASRGRAGAVERLARRLREPETWLVAGLAFAAGLLGALLG